MLSRGAGGTTRGRPRGGLIPSAAVRAIILHGPGDLRLEEIPEPEPAPGELILHVEVALTCATDAKMVRQGRHPALPSLPAPLGHEVVGTVAAVGAGAAWRPGERVVVANSAPCGGCFYCERGRPSLCEDLVYLSGAFAERLRVPARIAARNTLPVPPGLPSARAAMVEPLACAARTVERSPVAPGDVALVLGGGVQGLLLTALLARRGCRVILCDPHPERREGALRFGAAEAHPAPRDAATVARLRNATPGGRGADAVFEAVGRPEVWELALELVRPGGEVSFHGGCAPGTRASFDTFALHYREVTTRGSYHHTPETVRAALAHLRDGDAPYDELLGDPIGLSDVPRALAEGGLKRPVIP
jgi:L-iditol 2-dehydrogenase